MRLTVIGTGYLGAVHAACMADIGHDVLGVDVDTERITVLSEGRPPFYEPGFDEILNRALASGRLRFGTELRAAAAHGEVHFICVGTPQQAGSRAADLRYVDAVVDGLVPHLPRSCLVVGKSTVPVGTTARLNTRIAGLVPAGVRAEVAWNPEFLREGFAVEDTLRPDRLVVGVSGREADETLRRVYAPMLGAGVPYISTDPSTAELVKVAANSFLATKISFINAMSEVCDAAGADVATLADALGHDTRIGRQFLNAGLGFGGGCLPKDIRAFAARAQELGVGPAVEFLDQVDAINHRQRTRTVALVRRLAGGDLAGRRVAVLGATFKPDSDDVRDSPALAVATALHRQGAEVRVHDPEGAANARRAHPELRCGSDLLTACRGSDLVLHLTEWRQYREVDPVELARVVRTPVLVDGRNALRHDQWRAAGWAVKALGRPYAPAQPSDAQPLDAQSRNALRATIVSPATGPSPVAALSSALPNGQA
ncbi:UDP-glucose/GDP-mannose dehydrogenase family protein [Streptomyces sp. C11-1]|uniref:UDP-glucose 6-dehydrogenase n=1 Tax=Streptomyces durocortorensis TaxID=2811104 RepID=A0ABY9W3U5_9ACTN|nr:UDP-glucose/GDP-mannose dehydrogenase family protein [Streptomyces durocortorensis]WNF30658.1 UDP-glucose/GDP-mannose dehydrogenase family protein [Streptomyces durocortorensis]